MSVQRELIHRYISHAQRVKTSPHEHEQGPEETKQHLEDASRLADIADVFAAIEDVLVNDRNLRDAMAEMKEENGY